MIDSIAGYHLNPWTCGIAKFNAILARHLSLPVVGIGSEDLQKYKRPLLSLKLSEFTPDDAHALHQWVGTHAGRYELFLHAFDGSTNLVGIEVVHREQHPIHRHILGVHSAGGGDAIPQVLTHIGI